MMKINNLTASTIKSAHPVLKEKADEITDKMYQLLFEKSPELNKLFPSKDQSMKLAQTIIAYSEHIDNIEVLYPVLSTVSEKHAKANIKPEHYLLVCDALLKAMEAVLGGEAFTDELRKAWTDAYYSLAAVLIRAEQEHYRKLKLSQVSA